MLTSPVLFCQGEVRSGAGDFKGAVAAYKRAAAEAPELDLSLLQGLAEALVSDGRPQEAAEYLLEQRKLAEAGTGMDAVNLELLLGRVSCVLCKIYISQPKCINFKFCHDNNRHMLSKIYRWMGVLF